MLKSRPGSACQRLRLSLVAAALAWLAGAGVGYAAPSADNDVAAFRGVFDTAAITDARPTTPRAWNGLFAPGAGDSALGLASSILAQAEAQAAAGQFPPQPSPFQPPPRPSGQPSIAWGPLIGQAFEFLVIQHAWRATFEETTWQDTLEGSFWDDYFTSAGNLCCWDDGDKFTTNYIFHPALGSIASFIFAQNHYASKVTPPAGTGSYWAAKGKQGLFAFAYSAYFELGLVLSEAAIGNVGLDGNGMTWEDIVVTPAVGVMMSAGEDYLRSTLIERIDRWNHQWGVAAALFLNPTRSVANVLAFRKPWADPPWLMLRREERAREIARSQASQALQVR